MKHGLFFQIPCHSHQSAAERYKETLYQTELAEDLGFDSVWLGEIHFQSALGIMPSISLMASAIGQRTSRLRIGLGVSLLPLHDPLLSAEEGAMLDNLCEGRLEFGVGRGVLTFHDPFMLPPELSRERHSEALDIILKAWTTDSFSYQGKYYKVREASVAPKPLQKPHPPLTVAVSGSPGVFEAAARKEMGVMSGLFITPMDQLRERVGNYRDVEAELGRDPDPSFLKILQPTFISKTVAEARETTRASVNSYFDAVKDNLESPAGERTIAAVPEFQRFKNTRDEHTHEHIVETETDLYLTPDKAVERLQYIRSELPVGEVFHWFEMGGLIPHEKIVESMKLFAKEVLPHVQ